jgi:hypothetical protein
MPGVLGKVGFAVTAIFLFSQGRLDPSSATFAATDLAWAALFVWAFLALGRHNP